MTASISISKLKATSSPGVLQQAVWSGAGLLALLVYFWPQITRRNDPDGRHLTDKHNGAA